MDAFANYNPATRPRNTFFEAQKKYNRARTNAEKGAYGRAIAALLSDPTADTADSAMQADLSRLYPRPSKPAATVPHLAFLHHRVYPYPMLLELYNGSTKLLPQGRTACIRPVQQALVTNNEGEYPIYNFSAELKQFLQQFLDGKLPK